MTETIEDVVARELMFPSTMEYISQIGYLENRKERQFKNGNHYREDEDLPFDWYVALQAAGLEALDEVIHNPELNGGWTVAHGRSRTLTGAKVAIEAAIQADIADLDHKFAYGCSDGEYEKWAERFFICDTWLPEDDDMPIDPDEVVVTLSELG